MGTKIIEDLGKAAIDLYNRDELINSLDPTKKKCHVCGKYKNIKYFSYVIFGVNSLSSKVINTRMDV